MKVSQSCPTLCDPMDYTVHGILQASILEWVAVPISRGSSQPRDWTQVPCIAGGFFTSWGMREVWNTGVGSCSHLQGIFSTQGSNRGLLHCRRILYQLSYQGSPIKHTNGINDLLTCGRRCKKASPLSVPTAKATRKLRRNLKNTRFMSGTKITPSKDRKLMTEMAMKPPTQAVRRGPSRQKGKQLINFQSETAEWHKIICKRRGAYTCDWFMFLAETNTIL